MMPTPMPRIPPSNPIPIVSVRSWRDDAALRPADRPQRADLAHPLRDRREREQRGDHERGREHDDRRARCRAGRTARARPRGCRSPGRRDPSWSRPRRPGSCFLIDAATASTEPASFAFTSTWVTRFGLRRELLERREREVDVGGAAGERRAHQADDLVVGAVDRDRRRRPSTTSCSRTPRSRAPRSARPWPSHRPAVSWSWVTRPTSGCAGSTAAAVYDWLVMSVDGGFTTCWIVCSGVVNWRPELLEPRRQAVVERRVAAESAAATTEAAAASTAAGAATAARSAVLPPPGRPDRARPSTRGTRGTPARSASVIGSGRTVCVNVCPPVWIDATICGTVPVWCSASCTSPPTAVSTPSTFSILATALCGKLCKVAERKKSWVNLSPGFPSLDRSVMTLWFSLSSARVSWRFCCVVAVAAARRRSRRRRPRPSLRPSAGLAGRRRGRGGRTGRIGGRAGDAGDEDVGADRPQRREHVALRVVETLGDADDPDDEPDPERETERGEDRAAEAASQLLERVAQLKHGEHESTPDVRGLLRNRPVASRPVRIHGFGLERAGGDAAAAGRLPPRPGSGCAGELGPGRAHRLAYGRGRAARRARSTRLTVDDATRRAPPARPPALRAGRLARARARSGRARSPGPRSCSSRRRVAAPRLVAVDPTGEQCDVPAVLMTRVARPDPVVAARRRRVPRAARRPRCCRSTRCGSRHPCRSATFRPYYEDERRSSRRSGRSCPAAWERAIEVHAGPPPRARSAASSTATTTPATCCGPVTRVSGDRRLVEREPRLTRGGCRALPDQPGASPRLRRRRAAYRASTASGPGRGEYDPYWDLVDGGRHARRRRPEHGWLPALDEFVDLRAASPASEPPGPTRCYSVMPWMASMSAWLPPPCWRHHELGHVALDLHLAGHERLHAGLLVARRRRRPWRSRSRW